MYLLARELGISREQLFDLVNPWARNSTLALVARWPIAWSRAAQRMQQSRRNAPIG
jgi:hypothetical protein